MTPSLFAYKADAKHVARPGILVPARDRKTEIEHCVNAAHRLSARPELVTDASVLRPGSLVTQKIFQRRRNEFEVCGVH